MPTPTPRCICKCTLINISDPGDDEQWFCIVCKRFWNEPPRVEPTDQDYDLKEFDRQFKPNTDE